MHYNIALLPKKVSCTSLQKKGRIRGGFRDQGVEMGRIRGGVRDQGVEMGRICMVRGVRSKFNSSPWIWCSAVRSVLFFM